MPVVVLIGTLDTKHAEYAHLRGRLLELGCEVLLIDVGVLGAPGIEPDVGRDAVATAGGYPLAAGARGGVRRDQPPGGSQDEREAAVDAMGRGAAETVLRLYGTGRLDAVLALGGSTGTTIASRAMRALPHGLPKVLVSTMAAGDTSAYVGASDLTMMHPVVDVAGLNSVLLPVLENAVAATAAMALAYRPGAGSPPGVRAPGAPAGDVRAPGAPAGQHPPEPAPPGSRPAVATSMIGLTTPGVDAFRHRMSALGYDVLVFHATGTGGRALETLARDGALTAVADLTPTELADELVGGICSAGPDRLTAAGARGIPQVVALGGLDMVMFGPPTEVPTRYRDRRLHRHNAAITLMRTIPAECAELGRQLARKLNDARGPVTLFVPAPGGAAGLSLLSAPGEPFHDPVADLALVDALLDGLHDTVTVRHSPHRPGDPALGSAMADELHALCRTARPHPEPGPRPERA